MMTKSVSSDIRRGLQSALTTCAAADKGGKRKGRNEQERISKRKVSFSVDRRENQGARRLAGRDALAAARTDQGSRPRGRRGVEMERRSRVVARRTHLHRRDLQERREDDLREGSSAERPRAPIQLQPRRRQDQREGVEGSDPRSHNAEYLADVIEAAAPRHDWPRRSLSLTDPWSLRWRECVARGRAKEVLCLKGGTGINLFMRDKSLLN